MAFAAVRRFFDYFFRETPWYVSPVRVPCQGCAQFPPYSPPTNRENQRKCDLTCASRFEDEPETIPELKEHNEPSSIQLFYDLFFVANLFICTHNHPVTDSDSLATYVGFFSLLWFTWFCTIIFDVRFAIDSWFTRLSKAFSFGIMATFAMSTVFFDSKVDKNFGHDAQMISLILMASRLFLAFQYLVTMIAVYSRYREKSVIVPFAMTICTSLVAAAVFFGLHFSSFAGKDPHAVIGWYITSVAEAVVLLLISCYSGDLMKFDDSNIVERMGALTLIILGEGIIAMTEKVSLILSSSARISTSTVGLVISATLVIYVLWMLYFDHADKLDHPGGRINKQKPWCQLWTFFHFPLHTAILLTIEGSARFISWWSTLEALNFVDDNFARYWNFWPYVQNGTELANGVKLQLDNITTTYPFLVGEVNTTEFQANLTKLRNLGTFNGLSNDSIGEVLYNMGDALYAKTCDLFDIVTPTSLEGSAQKIDFIYEAYLDWFITFFVASGLVLIFLALERYLGHHDPSSKSRSLFKRDRRNSKHRVAWVAISLQFLIGIVVTFVGLLALLRNGRHASVWYNFLSSPWVIPTVLLAFSLVLVCDNFLYYWSSGTLSSGALSSGALSSGALSSGALSSDILHPPRSEGPAEKQKLEQELEAYKAETKRLNGMVRDLGADPGPGSLLKTTHGRAMVSQRSNEFGKNSESPLLKYSFSPPQQQYELDRISNRTGHLSATEMPLLRSSLSPPERDSDAVSARTEYSRLTVDPEEGYGG